MSTITVITGCSTTLPDPAITGLRYYYPQEKTSTEVLDVDICVYGGTSGGAAAAIQAVRMGKSVALLEFGKHIGGLTSGGLNETDGGSPEVCGGIAREFYNRAGQKGFTPSIAEKIYTDMLNAETGIEIRKLCQLKSVEKDGTRIISITMENGLKVRAKQFIDCTYEGDLMAMAGVSFTVGRESADIYGEKYNGILTPGKGGHNFPFDIDPYVVKGDPSSGLLPRINDDWGETSEGDERIQAYCFRMWLTQDNLRPFPKPPVYEPAQYEILARLFEADPWIRWNRDTNNHHLFKGTYFIDYVGGADEWPDGDYATRERIFQEHVNYQLGVMWFLQNSPRVPAEYQKIFKTWGLPRDEYTETGGWTHQLYIREGRRMVSNYVMTEHNCMGRETAEDSIGLASYNMDSHIAFGSIRMEPIFMILGQSAATAACFAIEDGAAVQDVPYKKLKQKLIEDKQCL